MPEISQKKDHYQLNKGINTESNELGFPDGYSVDEQNYELLVDGSRKRRKGLATETGGSSKATGQTIGAAHAYSAYKWRGVGGNPDKNFVVHQIGDTLFFTDDAETISTTYHTEVVVLSQFLVDSDTYATADVEDSVVQFSQGRGVLLISGKYITPFYIEYDATNDRFNPTAIEVRIRDFDGIEDGVSVQSLQGTLSADHEYNLRNRGWKAADIVTYQANSSGSVYPSKAMSWFKGYRRQTDVLYSDLDGIQVFGAPGVAKLEAEQFGQSTAPQGGLFLDPLDTRYAANTTNEGDEVLLDSWVIQSGTSPAALTMRVTTASVHGRTTNDVVNLSGTLYVVDLLPLGKYVNVTLDGYHTITVIDTTTFDITLKPGRIDFIRSITTTGQINGNVALPKSDGKELSVGPTACGYHAGRAWFAGIQDSEYADTIFFSKIAQKPLAFGICYQEDDPTDPELNQLSSSDGGTIVIPNLGKVQRMVSMRDLLLVFSDQGVWEIGGGQRGVFTATGYSVRKITESECSSSRSPVVIGNRVVYTGPRGIHLIIPNQFTSVLEEGSISEDQVQTLWNAIPTARQEVVQTVYDSARSRLYFLYGDTGDNANHYANTLVLDLRIRQNRKRRGSEPLLESRIGSFYKYVFNTTATSGLLGAYSITDSDSSNSNKKIKWTTQDTNAVDTCDLNQTDFIDFDGAESPLPFVTTGWDNIGSFQRRRQAPVITVFAKRTETGYTDTGTGLDPVNESSSLLTARWDWTDDSVSGKIGSQNETYRHVRGFVPSGTTDVDGYPVVVTRNKLRGRGRVLQLRFDGAATKDSHILGFTVNYKVTRKV